MTSEKKRQALKDADVKEAPSVIRFEEEYRPKPEHQGEGDGKKGFQPKPPGKPEGQNPPSGGSNVNPPRPVPDEKEKMG